MTADARRVPAGTAGWLAAHQRGGLPARDQTWYAFDAGPFRGLVLDTVNAAGGWQGSLDAEQFAWLERELEVGSSTWTDSLGRSRRARREDRTFLIFSHHPLATLVNDWAPHGGRRALAGEVEALLGRFPNVAAWFNGHTHTHRIQAHRADPHRAPGHPGWWEVTTASHVDWPQQARVVELAEDPQSKALVIASTVVDHAGLLDPRVASLGGVETLAGWSRELAANHWQRAGAGGPEPVGRGLAKDRNVVLVRPRRA